MVVEIKRCSRLSKGSTKEVEESSGEDTPWSIVESNRELGRCSEGTSGKPIRELFKCRLPEVTYETEEAGKQAKKVYIEHHHFVP